MRDFIDKHKSTLKFVLNFHCFGKMIVTPYSSVIPNTMAERNPLLRTVMTEIISEAKFPEKTDIGPASEILGKVVGGAAGDWIASTYDIPAVEPEIGAGGDYGPNWLPVSFEKDFEIIQ